MEKSNGKLETRILSPKEIEGKIEELTHRHGVIQQQIQEEEKRLSLYLKDPGAYQSSIVQSNRLLDDYKRDETVLLNQLTEWRSKLEKITNARTDEAEMKPSITGEKKEQKNIKKSAQKRMEHYLKLAALTGLVTIAGITAKRLIEQEGDRDPDLIMTSAKAHDIEEKAAQAKKAGDFKKAAEQFARAASEWARITRVDTVNSIWMSIANRKAGELLLLSLSTTDDIIAFERNSSHKAEMALDHFEKAYLANPRDEKSVWDYARLLYEKTGGRVDFPDPYNENDRKISQYADLAKEAWAVIEIFLRSDSFRIKDEAKLRMKNLQASCLDLLNKYYVEFSTEEQERWTHFVNINCFRYRKKVEDKKKQQKRSEWWKRNSELPF